MEVAPSPEVIRATQDSLGRFVKRPPLTEKLLKKPPFRFLHDIVTSVLKSNGFFDGLFEEAELISENVKDRDSKIQFLTKVINVLSLTTGKTLTVKPSKIISGQEPEKTNELLQCLGNALEQNLSTLDAVQKYKNKSVLVENNEKNTKNLKVQSKDKTTVKPRENAKLTSKSTEKLTNLKDKRDQSVSNKKDVIKKDKNPSISNKDVQKSRRDSSVTRKDTNKETKETSKELGKDKAKKPDKTLIAQKSFNDSPPKPVPKHTTIAKTNSIIFDEKEADTHMENNDTDLIGDNLVTSDSKDSQGNLNQTSIESTEHKPQEDSNQNYSEAKFLDNGVVDRYNSEKDHKSTIITPKRENMDDFDPNKDDAVPLTNAAQEKNELGNIKIEHENISPKPTPLTRRETTEKNEALDSKPPSAVEKNKFDNQSYNRPTETPPTASVISRVVSAKSTVLRPPSARPPSARPGAPRLRDKHEDLLSATEPVPTGKVNIIVENAELDADEDEASLVIVESATNDQTDKDHSEELAMQYSSADHGHLVQQILDSQKEFSQMQSGKTEIEWEFGAQRVREASSQEVEQLRFSLQALSRAANPLGKLLDHIQEDVEVMRQELQQWNNSYEEATIELTKEKSRTEHALQPLQARSVQLDAEIAEKRDKINDLKSIIHKNTTRINQLLESGIVQ